MVTDQEQEMSSELEAVKEELEGLKREREVNSRESEARDEIIIKLEKALAERDGEIATLKQSLTDAESETAELGETLAQAVARYKDLIVQSNAGVLVELITGSTVAEVDESLKNAQVLVERVRQEVEAEAAKTKVPAGAPQRALLDVSALSPREKIQYAIGGNR